MACPTIVVIEDDEDIRESILSLLELEGFRAVGFSNGRDAMDRLGEFREPCLILLDLMMPVMNGWEFMQQRRKLGDTILAIPVVLISAIASVADLERTGARAFLRKPVDLEALLRMVRQHCGAAEQVA
jgi:CheY-like chemotaxis protein